MLTRLTAFCVRHAWSVIAAAAVLSGLAGVYAAGHFAIDTNTDWLMPADLPWVQREHAYQALFPPKQMLAAVQAPTPELAGDAADRLVKQLGDGGGKVHAVEQPQADPVLLRAALLLPPLPELQRTLMGLERCRPLPGALAADPTLRGILQAGTGLARSSPHALDKPAAALAHTLETAFRGGLPSFSWRALMQDQAPTDADRRQLLPRGDPNDTDAMADFARAVLSVAPGASGSAITLLESERTVVRAFIEAGALAVLSIAVILWIALRTLVDVLMTLVPLLVAGAVTLEVTVLIGQPMWRGGVVRPPCCNRP